MTAKPTARKQPDTRPRINDVFLRRPLTRLVAQWRKRADKTARRPKPNAFCDPWTLGLRAGETHAFRRCATQLSRILIP